MRILSSSFFRESPAASRFLSYVVETALSDQTNHIKQYTIAVDAFGYPDDFDPQTNPAMRIIAGRMRSMLERYYRHDGAHDDIRIEIPKRTYFPVFRFNSKTQKTGHARLSREPSLESIADYGLSIAVLPFGNRQSHENKGCADDITESIVVGLSQFHELHIVGPLLTYKDCTVETDQVARRYHVRFVLQGSVRIYGATLRVAANLTDAFTGFKVWSQTYEYTLTAQNLLEIEDDVSRLIVNALADYSGIIPCHISRESKKKNPDSMEIHEAICSQNLYMKVFSIETHRAAIEALERALKTNSDNPLAMAMLGTAYCCNDLFDLIPGTSRLDESERLVKQAEVLDPECQIAHLTEAVVRFVQGQADRCIAKIGLAISLNPFNAYVGHACGFMLGMLGHWEDGMQLWENATRLNPNHSPFYFMVPFMNHYRRGDYEKAWSYAVRFNVPIFWDPLIRAAAAGQLGMYPQAAASLEELLEMRPDFASRGRDLVRRLAYSDEHVEMLFEGLFKAGFQPNPTG
jgi:TolB-like protein